MLCGIKSCTTEMSMQVYRRYRFITKIPYFRVRLKYPGFPAYTASLCSSVCLKKFALQLCSQLLLLWDACFFDFTISPSFTNAVSLMFLLCPLPERQHVLSGQLNQDILLRFVYLAGKANSSVKHMQSTFASAGLS